MAGVDAEHVKRVVYEASKDSDYFKEAARRDAVTDARCAALGARLAQLSPPELAAADRAARARLDALDAGRDLSRAWVCVDMDAFFASVEIRDNPALADVPMAVGGMSMITTSNYVARRYGVRAAMPGFIARRLCPALVLVPPRFDAYVAAAEATRRVFAEFDPDFIAGSLDEAYLDLTAYCAAHALTPAAAAASLRAAVTSATRLTCSAGVAPNRLLAKMCSDINKPNGQCVLPPDADAIRAFLAPTAVRKLPGVGRVTERLLAACGAVTCGDTLARAGVLTALLSPATSEFVLASAAGHGPVARPPEPAPGEAGRKGMSVERTFRDCAEPSALEARLRELAAALAAHLAREGLRPRQLTLKLKSAAFEVRTRQAALPGGHSGEEADIAALGLRLLRAELPLCCRLMGLRASGFLEPPPPGQRTLGFAAQGAPPPPGCFACARCGGAAVREEARGEHEDFHVARELSARLREEDAAEARAAAASQGGKRAREQPEGSIQSLFKRAGAKGSGGK